MHHSAGMFDDVTTGASLAVHVVQGSATKGLRVMPEVDHCYPTDIVVVLVPD